MEELEELEVGLGMADDVAPKGMKRISLFS